MLEVPLCACVCERCPQVPQTLNELRHNTPGVQSGGGVTLIVSAVPYTRWRFESLTVHRSYHHLLPHAVNEIEAIQTPLLMSPPPPCHLVIHDVPLFQSNEVPQLMVAGQLQLGVK